ncbi:MAG TPA: hypothetical protein VHU85_07245 [Acidimicrobiales bacterium]|nr:hypothetical protein [Acidimicrobiales bacterium]
MAVGTRASREVATRERDGGVAGFRGAAVLRGAAVRVGLDGCRPRVAVWDAARDAVRDEVRRLEVSTMVATSFP